MQPRAPARCVLYVEMLCPPAFRGLPASRVASCGSRQTLRTTGSLLRHIPFSCARVKESEVQSATASFSPM
jgi:hypothetical protein